MAPQKKYTTLQVINIIVMIINMPFVIYLCGAIKDGYKWKIETDNNIKSIYNKIETLEHSSVRHSEMFSQAQQERQKINEKVSVIEAVLPSFQRKRNY